MLPENVKRNGSNIISMDHRLGLQKATKKKQYEKKIATGYECMVCILHTLNNVIFIDGILPYLSPRIPNKLKIQMYSSSLANKNSDYALVEHAACCISACVGISLFRIHVIRSKRKKKMGISTQSKQAKLAVQYSGRKEQQKILRTFLPSDEVKVEIFESVGKKKIKKISRHKYRPVLYVPVVCVQCALYTCTVCTLLYEI